MRIYKINYFSGICRSFGVEYGIIAREMIKRFFNYQQE